MVEFASKAQDDSTSYRDIPKEEIPNYITEQGVSVRVIAGTSNGVTGAMTREDTEPLYIDIDLPAGSTFATSFPPTHNAFVYVYRGAVTIGDKTLAENRMGILANTPKAVGVRLNAAVPSKAILISGKPLGEPIMQHGPFVMNTKEEIYQAIRDYQEGRLGSAG
jgi:redox-sensitive bicupin YhaK (pirin superfamily)